MTLNSACLPCNKRTNALKQVTRQRTAAVISLVWFLKTAHIGIKLRVGVEQNLLVSCFRHLTLEPSTFSYRLKHIGARQCMATQWRWWAGHGLSRYVDSCQNKQLHYWLYRVKQPRLIRWLMPEQCDCNQSMKSNIARIWVWKEWHLSCCVDSDNVEFGVCGCHCLKGTKHLSGVKPTVRGVCTMNQQIPPRTLAQKIVTNWYVDPKSSLIRLLSPTEYRSAIIQQYEFPLGHALWTISRHIKVKIFTRLTHSFPCKFTKQGKLNELPEE